MKIRLKYNAPVILTFVIVCALVLIVSQISGYQNLDWFVTARGPLTNIRTWITMFTYVLGHASVDHFLGNMMLLLLTGPGIEEKYGSAVTLIIMLTTAFATALVNMIVSSNGLIGCSGIVFAFIILSSMTSFQKGEIPLTLVLTAVLYLGQEAAAGLFAADNVSQMAHILGGIAGAVFGFFLSGTCKRKIY